MNEFNIKPGDLIYCPIISNKIMKVQPKMIIRATDTDGRIREVVVMENGKWIDSYNNPAMFPATDYWYEKLSHVYPNLEKPPVRKSSKDIIQAMLDDGYVQIPCLVSDILEKPNSISSTDLLMELDESANFPFRCSGHGWKYATPFDPKTGRVIIDYVDGNVVLGDDY